MEVENTKSSTTAKTALGLSIGALGVELLNGQLGNLLGNVGNGGAKPSGWGCCTPASEIMEAFALNCANNNASTRQIAALESVISQLKSEKYTDNHILEAWKDSNASLNAYKDQVGVRFKETFDELVNNRVASAVQAEQIKCMQKEFDYKLAATAATAKADIAALDAKLNMTAANLGHAIEVEAERRCVADESIKKWTECNFVQYKKVVDSTQLCPPVTLANGIPSNATAVYYSTIPGTVPAVNQN